MNIKKSSLARFLIRFLIAHFFREIGRADELGSGIRNLMKYGKAFGGSDPELIEGDVFRIVVKYPDSTVYDRDLTATEDSLPSSVPSLSQATYFFNCLIALVNQLLLKL